MHQYESSLDDSSIVDTHKSFHPHSFNRHCQQQEQHDERDMLMRIMARAYIRKQHSSVVQQSTMILLNRDGFDDDDNDHDDGQGCLHFYQHEEGVYREKYTLEEMENLKDRDFEVRLFMTHHMIWGKSVFLQSHFSDNHEYSAGSFKFLNDFLRASSDTYSYTAAKAALTNLLTIALDTDEGEYRTFAITVASALSNHAENTFFEVEHDDRYAMVQDDSQLQRKRKNFCELMHVIFDKIPIYKFMVEQDGSNIYRLVHCSSQSTIDEELPLPYAIFSFLLQICLSGYVIAQLWINIGDGSYTLSPDNENLEKMIRNLPLAIMTLLYSILLAVPEIKNVPKGLKVFASNSVGGTTGGGRFGSMLQIMDFTVNAILPILLLVPGFFVILDQDEFIEAVLNAAALLYITAIDDQLPLLLGCNTNSIVKNFLMDKAMEEFDSIKSSMDQHHQDGVTMEGWVVTRNSKNVRVDDAKAAMLLEKEEQPLQYGGTMMTLPNIQFCDYYLTNMPEQGSSPAEGLIFQPFQIRCGHNSHCGDKIDPTRIVSEECLIRRITWQYDAEDIQNQTTHPRIAYLKLDLYDSMNPVKIESKQGMNPNSAFHTLQGVYIITTFQMSVDNSITRLRLCGSKTTSNFLKAFEYYPLWNLSKGAKLMLKTESQTNINALSRKVRNKEEVSRGSIGRTRTVSSCSSTVSCCHQPPPAGSAASAGHYDRMVETV